MAGKPLEATSVTAHTETGPFGERGELAMPLETVGSHAEHNLNILHVHAKLSVENPILEHVTFQAGRALTLTAQLDLGQLCSPILCLYQHKEWWMRPMWVNGLVEVPERTQMLLWKTHGISNGTAVDRWHVLLAVSAGSMRADIRGARTDEEHVIVDVSTNQAGLTSLDGPVLMHAYGNDPYEIIERCVLTVTRHLPLLPRGMRPFPEALRGFGWCTWDAFGQQVSEEDIFAKMDEFRAKHVPVSWVLIDDGWSQTQDNMLTGFGADPERFPQGLSHTVHVLKQEYGVRYVGVWQAFQGYWGGVDPTAVEFSGRDAMFETLPDGMTVPAYGDGMFWRHWDGMLADAGVDFAKVDSQSTMSVLTRGVESFAALLDRHRDVDLAAGESFGWTVINCMGMAPENYWRRPYSPVTRTSDDFFPRIPESLAEHAIENAYCSLLLGNMYHCDWDMFWTRHPHARTHMLLRWISGGPIYCSDGLDRTNPEMLACLFDADGDLTHPDGVGVPAERSVLNDPVHTRIPLAIRNTFRGRDVELIVGLNAELAQPVSLTAEADGIGVQLPDGTERIVRAGETFTTELSYGECVLVQY